jgi:hypothetical protein
MCFSAEASFTVGGALLPAGGFCIASALRKRPKYLPLAIVPFIFGLQQLSEGVVWIGIRRNNPELIRSASLVFLFFALAFWPFWFPLLTSVMETRRARRHSFIILTIISTFWFWVLYYPLLTGPESLLVTEIINHSIQYDILRLPIYNHVSVWPLRAFYFFCVALPLAFGSEGLGAIAGVIFGASAVFCGVVYAYAFVSVWCFFAAILTLYLCRIFYALPAREVRSEPARA